MEGTNELSKGPGDHRVSVSEKPSVSEFLCSKVVFGSLVMAKSKNCFKEGFFGSLILVTGPLLSFKLNEAPVDEGYTVFVFCFFCLLKKREM